MVRRFLTLVAFLLLSCAPLWTQAPVRYELSFPEPERHSMQVAVTFEQVPAGPLDLRISRSSPGRYALHDFAKHVSDVRATDPRGAPLRVSRPNTQQWRVENHPGGVRVTYRVAGTRLDGTYLAIDTTHAHINMPAALMWARGFEDRPATVRFEPPTGTSWRVGTQLLAGNNPFEFTAPNLQYLMDSPAELSDFALRTFAVDVPASPVFRIAIHHTGTETELNDFVDNVKRIVREAWYVYGEYPAFEGDTYTFIADYLPSAREDGMEHRNSTVLTSSSSLRSNRLGLLDTASHEFFHAWNVERIRPRSLEPFNFEEANPSDELWFAEGFTSYYGPLLTLRSGVASIADFAVGLSSVIDGVRNSPARRVRSAEGMSRLAPLVDGAASVDPSIDKTYISYYTWGGAIGLGLDLTLRDRTNGAVTLDHYMRALWKRFGKPGGKAPGYVDHPYTPADLKMTLAVISGDAQFANDFFTRFIQGHEVVDYERLFNRAGFLLRDASAGHVRVVPAEQTGRSLTPEQHRFRAAWLSSAVRNTF